MGIISTLWRYLKSDVSDEYKEEIFCCPICQEEKDLIYKLECNHEFCVECIVRYFRVSRDCRCPVCRDSGGIEDDTEEDEPESINLERMCQIKDHVRKIIKNDCKFKKKKKGIDLRKKNLKDIARNTKSLEGCLKKTTEWRKHSMIKRQYIRKRNLLGRTCNKFRQLCVDNVENEFGELSRQESSHLNLFLKYSLGFFYLGYRR